MTHRMMNATVTSLLLLAAMEARAADVVKLELRVDSRNPSHELLVITHTEGATFRFFQSEEQGKVVVEGQNLVIPPNLTRVLVPLNPNGPVAQATPYNSMNGKSPMAKLVLKLRGAADVTTSDLPGQFVVSLSPKILALPYIGPEKKKGEKGAKLGWSEHDSVATKLGAPSKSEEIAQKLVEVLNAPDDEKKYFGSKVTFEGSQVDIHDIFRLVGEASGLNIVTDAEVSAKANFSLKDIPWDQLLDLVIQQGGFKAMVLGNVVRIMTLKAYTDQSMLRKQEITASDEIEPVILSVVPVSYASAADMLKLIQALVQTKVQPGGGAVPLGAAGAAAGAQSAAQPLSASADNDKSLGQDFKRGQIAVDDRTNSLIITNTKDAIERIRRLVKELDVPVPQILVDSKFVIASETFANSVGVQWGSFVTSGSQRAGVGMGFADGTISVTTPSSSSNSNSGFSVATPGNAIAGSTGTGNGVTGGSGGSATGGTPGFGAGFRVGAGSLGALTAALNLSEADALSKTIASPRVTVNNKKTATITDGESITIPLAGNGTQGASSTSVTANLQLSVLPQVTADGSVQMHVTISDDTIPAGGLTASNVTVATQKVDTDVLVDSGATLVLGGVYQMQKTDATQGVPLLKDLPFIGALFQVKNTSDTKSELMVFITPQILDPEANTGVGI